MIAMLGAVSITVGNSEDDKRVPPPSLPDNATGFNTQMSRTVPASHTLADIPKSTCSDTKPKYG